MNMFKKNGGFTLVELIVVIAILAILAGVAVPAYTGYMAKAEEAAINSELSAVLTAAQAQAAMANDEVKQIVVTPSSGAIAVTCNKDSGSTKSVSTLVPFYADTLEADVTGYTTVTWNAATTTTEAGWTLTAK